MSPSLALAEVPVEAKDVLTRASPASGVLPWSRSGRARNRRCLARAQVPVEEGKDVLPSLLARVRVVSERHPSKDEAPDRVVAVGQEGVARVRQGVHLGDDAERQEAPRQLLAAVISMPPRRDAQRGSNQRCRTRLLPGRAHVARTSRREKRVFDARQDGVELIGLLSNPIDTAKVD